MANSNTIDHGSAFKATKIIQIKSNKNKLDGNLMLPTWCDYVIVCVSGVHTNANTSAGMVSLCPPWDLVSIKVSHQRRNRAAQTREVCVDGPWSHPLPAARLAEQSCSLLLPELWVEWSQKTCG